jgi:hypothetical protein
MATCIEFMVILMFLIEIQFKTLGRKIYVYYRPKYPIAFCCVGLISNFYAVSALHLFEYKLFSNRISISLPFINKQSVPIVVQPEGILFKRLSEARCGLGMRKRKIERRLLISTRFNGRSVPRAIIHWQLTAPSISNLRHK